MQLLFRAAAFGFLLFELGSAPLQSLARLVMLLFQSGDAREVFSLTLQGAGEILMQCLQPAIQIRGE